MKQALFYAVCIFLFVSCKKQAVEEPLDPNKAYTIKLEVNDQVTKTRVSNDTLYLNFEQKLNFLVDPTEYSRSWALHLTQDFANSYLNNLHFKALANSNGYANDWVPVNMNDVHPSQKSTSEVTVNGQKFTKVTFTRVFEFYNKVATSQEAVNKQDELVQATNQTVTYASFYSYGDIYSLPNKATAKIVYTK